MLLDCIFVVKTIWQRNKYIYDHKFYNGLRGRSGGFSLSHADPGDSPPSRMDPVSRALPFHMDPPTAAMGGMDPAGFPSLTRGSASGSDGRIRGGHGGCRRRWSPDREGIRDDGHRIERALAMTVAVGSVTMTNPRHGSSSDEGS